MTTMTAAPLSRDTVEKRASEAALSLAADRPWAEITLRDIATASGLAFVDLYRAAPSKTALLGRISAQLDLAALTDGEIDPAADAHDRLFEAVMARLDAMAPNRAALLSIAKSDGLIALAPRLPFTARALLEAAGIPADGLRGAPRVAAMTATWLRILIVWREDDGALNRTMAEADRQLKTLRTRLKQVGAGF